MPPKRKVAVSSEVSRKRPRSEAAIADHNFAPSTSIRSKRSTVAPVKEPVVGTEGLQKKKKIPKTSNVSNGSLDQSKNEQATTKPTQSANSRSSRKVKEASGSGSQTQVDDDSTANEPEAKKDDASQNYWLMKAEPEDRFENGHNVKFAIDDLEAATKPEPWDGVRNYAARNNMIAMRKNDLAFFYHSNCAVPGIVGIMKIVEEHTVDQSAFDPKHPYYDAKSQREKPRWELVHVGFVKKFGEKISLRQIQQNAASTKELADMDLLKYKRLSVTRVRPAEWDYIIDWAGESVEFKSTET